MRKFYLFLVISCLTYQYSTAQCLLPQGKGDTITPVTNNYFYDSSVNRGKSIVYTVARTGNQYYVSGNFTNIGPNMGSGVVVDSGSKAVLSSKAWKFNGFVRTSIPDGHGGFYVGGDFTQIGDSVRNHLAQIDAAGRPTPWSPNVNGNVYTLLKKNDTLFLGGQFHKVNSQQRIIFAAISLSGDSLLPYKLGFVDTVDNEEILYSIKQYGANKLFLAGGLQYSLHSNIEEYDLTGNGSITEWQPQFPIYGTVYSVDISQDGKTVYSAEGSFGYVRANDVLSGDQHFAVQLTYGFGFDNQGVSHSVKVVGNTLYIAGSFNGVNGVPRHGLCAVDASTGQLRDFDLNLNTSYAEYVDLVQGNLVVSGPFTMTGSLEREHFLMVDTSDAHIVASWNPSPSDVVFTVSGSGGKLFLGGYFNGLQSIHRNQLAGFDGTTGAILPFAPPADNTGGGIAMGQKMVIVGDTLFLFGRTDPSINLPPLKIKLYQLSTGLPIAVDGDLNFTSLNDFLIGGNFLYAAVDNSVRRFNLPGLHLDATWKADFSSLQGAPTARVLCQDANTIYAVGIANTAFVSKTDKGDASKSTLWTYYDTVMRTNSVAQFGQAVLGDSILFVSGGFNSLNGKIANGMGAINVQTGEALNWSPPFIPNLPPILRQPGNNARKIFLNNSALWTGFNFDLLGAPADIPFAFGALDSTSGSYLPTSVSLTGRDDGGGFMTDPYNNGTNLVTAANDFLFDSDYCMIVGKFDRANGEIHGNIVRLSYGSYNPPAGLPPIIGPDTVTSSSDSIAFSLPAGLSYAWSYTGSDARIIDTSANPTLLSFGANAGSGLLNARSTGYCNSGHFTAQKAVHVVHFPAKPATASCCLSFSNILSDRVSLKLTAGNGSGRLIIASTSRPSSQPIKAKTYLADTRFGLGQDLGGGNFPVYSGSGDSLTVTGLQPGTIYYFTVYDYNGAADTINYLTTSFAFGSTTTLPAEPTLPPSDISFSNISTTSFTISCTPGNGFARLYLLKAIDTVQASPVDGDQYLPDTRFQYGYGFADSSYVVGSFGSQITVSNLKPGTIYQIKLFEYNGGGFTQNYLQSAYAAGSVTTLSLAVPPDTATAIPTVAASNIHFENITINSVQASCVAGNGTSRLFVIHPFDTIISLPVNGQTYTPNTIFGKGSDLGNGTYAVGATAGTSVAITGLAPGTLYLVAVFEAMGAGIKSSYLVDQFPSRSFTTMTPGSTAINWQDSGFVVTVYPNPVQQSCHLRIVSNEAGNLAVKVLSATGGRVLSYNYNVAPGPNDIELKDFAGLARGIYLIYWNIRGHQGSEKVYKE